MNKQTAIKALSTIAMSFATTFSASAAYAHSGAAHEKTEANLPVSAEEYTFGRQGNPKKVTRTIAIDMADTMRFGPGNLVVKEGETIKFVVTNKGKMMHEMVIGTMTTLKEHGDLMKKHAGMEHDEPYMSHVSPGKKEEMVWEFTKAGEYYFACLIPGHFEAGMIGKISVRKG